VVNRENLEKLVQRVHLGLPVKEDHQDQVVHEEKEVK